MKPFVFRLAKVRSLRERAEQSAKDELARTLGERSRLEQSAADAESLVSLAASSRSDAIDPAAAELHEMYVDRRRREREAAHAAVARHEPYVQACTASLQAAALEAETLRRLEMRRRQAYLTEAARIAMAELDEFAVMRAARGSAT